MNRSRAPWPLLLLGLLLACAPVEEGPAEEQGGPLAPVTSRSSLVWSQAAPMRVPRSAHTATLLLDGRLLVVGGRETEDTVASAELYDPETDTWAFTGSLAEGRGFHTATLLRDGRVLVAGGLSRNFALTSAELYDPSTGRWSPTGALTQALAEHAAVRLADGRVLVVGSTWDDEEEGARLARAEVYDPETGTWAPTASPKGAYIRHTATLLPDGRVLVVGHNTLSTRERVGAPELYDPETGTWSSTGPLPNPRGAHTATLLPNGQVLVLGGERMSGGRAISGAEVYNPATNTWASRGALAAGRYSHTATLLSSGKVLVAGGSGAPLTEFHDPASSRTAFAEPLARGRHSHTATVMPNGRVLIVGGISGDGDEILSSVELLKPVIQVEPSPASLTRDTAATLTFASLLSSDSDAFECSLDGAAFTACTSPQRYASLEDGPHHFRVRYRGTGEEEPRGSEYLWTVDTVPPPLPAIHVPQLIYMTEPIQPFSTSTPVFSGSAEPGSTVWFFIDGKKLGRRWAGGKGDWEFQTPWLSNGSHDFSVLAVDPAGNSSEPAWAYFAIDATAERPTIQVPTEHQEFFTSTPTFSGAAEPRAQVLLYVDGEWAGQAVAGEDGRWQISTQRLEWGRHSVSAIAPRSDRNHDITPGPGRRLFVGGRIEPSNEVTFFTHQRGSYGMSCAVGVSSHASWLLALLVLLLSRRARSR